MVQIIDNLLPGISKSAALRHYRRRRFYDRLTRWGMAVGGISVIFAVLLIFVYLLSIVLPLFSQANLMPSAEYALPHAGSGDTVVLVMDEHAKIAGQYTTSGQVNFFTTQDGKLVDKIRLPIPEQVTITTFARSAPTSGIMGFGLSDGTVIVVQQIFAVSFGNGSRTISPKIDYPLGPKPLVLDNQTEPFSILAIQSDGDRTTLVAGRGQSKLWLNRFEQIESFLDDDTSFARSQTTFHTAINRITHLLLNKDQDTLYVSDSRGMLARFDVGNADNPELLQQLLIAEPGNEINALQFLNGDISLMVGESSGTISQWFPVRDKDNVPKLKLIRQFGQQQGTAIRQLVSEPGRKGFFAIDETNRLGLYYATSERNLLLQTLGDSPVKYTAISPRADVLLTQNTDNRITYWQLENEHPDVSWKVLWEKVWYESYPKPEFIWQSSAADNDFEPKFSLVPLTFGTLKAAFYAMLVATPLAIFGAIYTAYFMTPRVRQVVKPTIEIMEALPTVILGFLAGLWLAPVLEANLAGIFTLLLIVPFGSLIFAYFWHHTVTTRLLIPEGWESVIMIPVIIFLTWLALALNQPVQDLLFDGDIIGWLNRTGVDFDQRNSIVVGFAMGFAVIPTIFSITEDAIFGVPKHLTNGSLALGATSWQTLSRVVLLTASPGIFSAVMIGFGRAVGETMIVLMATGNTPVMDFSVFQGFRTLAANIAVEIPETEVASTHFRVLFLAALVLFAFTFLVNTLAEIIRQHLRSRYSSL